MKRVMLFISSLAAGGAERTLSQLANRWVEQGVEVELATWASANEPDFFPLSPKVKRTILSQPGRATGLVDKVCRGFRIVRRMRGLMKALRPDAVLAFIDITNVLVVCASLGLGIPVILSERIDPSVNNTLTRKWRFARALTYRWASGVVAQTATAAAWLKAHCAARPVWVIPNFIRPTRMPMVERSRLIISIGRLVSQKGFADGIRAFAATQRRTSWTYVILGDGPLRADLEALSVKLGVADQVRFMGLVNDVESWLERAAICLQPSYFEGFPNAVLEAMAMGVAVISTNCRSGPSDLIEDGRTGRLVPVGDVAALTDALQALIDNAALRQAIGARAMEVRERFAAEVIMKKWNDVLGLAPGGGTNTEGIADGSCR